MWKFMNVYVPAELTPGEAENYLDKQVRSIAHDADGHPPRAISVHGQRPTVTGCLCNKPQQWLR